MAQAAGRARAVAGEDALNDERVEVDVQVRRRPEALDRGDGPTAAVGGTATPRATSLEGQHRTDEHSEHAPAEPLVVRERVAQPVRRGEHPLPYGKAAKHVVHEVGGEACHATRRARRAEAAALAGERDQKVGATRVAAEAGEAARELAAGQELPQLALDEVRQAVTVTASTRLGEKGLQVLVDEPVQRAVLGRARAVTRKREPRGVCGDDSANRHNPTPRPWRLRAPCRPSRPCCRANFRDRRVAGAREVQLDATPRSKRRASRRAARSRAGLAARC
ncbi:hypothetical protein K2Z84_15430, partial [Candidatus Binatia bacterium]|nr:hypothetical protein [Candidatus Binatia bacterium]